MTNKIEIPAVLVVAVIVLIVGLIIGINVKHSKNNISDKYELMNDSLRKVDSALLSDTISYFNALVIESEGERSKYKEDLLKVKGELNKHISEASKKQPSEIYPIMQEYLPNKTDSEEYVFSGNQIKRLHSDHIELMDSRDMIEAYVYITDQQDKTNGQLKKQVELLNYAQEVQYNYFEDCKRDYKMLSGELDACQNRTFWERLVFLFKPKKGYSK